LDSFNWSAAISYVDATYQDGYVADTANNTSNAAVVPGNRIPGIPDLQLKLRGSYQITSAWRVGSNIVYMGSSYLQANENNGYQANPAKSYFGNGKADAYTVVHLDTTYKIENSNWQLLGKINNLFDTKFNTGGIQGHSLFDYKQPFAYQGDDYRDSLFAPGAPRALWVGVKYEFDKPKK
jgi:outer membrane receptor for ferrienterochelin and colicin